MLLTKFEWRELLAVLDETGERRCCLDGADALRGLDFAARATSNAEPAVWLLNDATPARLRSVVTDAWWTEESRRGYRFCPDNGHTELHPTQRIATLIESSDGAQRVTLRFQ